MQQALDNKYKEQLAALAETIQASEQLAKYLDEEEEEMYMELKETFEPQIAEIHEEIAKVFPLQLVSFEKELLDPAFEGLFLPKMLGYAVLRGELTDKLKYVRPQEHFKDVILAICNSANFDILKKRIGQSIQMGFAFSSDIWVTNLINGIQNKRVRYYLNGHKLPKYRILEGRTKGYLRYKKQFIHDHFQTARFPKTPSELKVYFNSLKNFVLHRILHAEEVDNTTTKAAIMEFVADKHFYGMAEHLRIAILLIGFFDHDKKETKELKLIIKDLKTKVEEFDHEVLLLILELHKNTSIELDSVVDNRLSSIINNGDEREIDDYLELMDTYHDKGFTTPEAQSAVADFYSKYEGLSLVNACVRRTVYDSFRRFISNLPATSYPDFFEISKHFTPYMETFANQKFVQRLKVVSMTYLKKLMKTYTDKRGKDYQDIKKFVATSFVDFGFLTKKEVVEFFKTRRKRKVKAE